MKNLLTNKTGLNAKITILLMMLALNNSSIYASPDLVKHYEQKWAFILSSKSQIDPEAKREALIDEIMTNSSLTRFEKAELTGEINLDRDRFKKFLKAKPNPDSYYCVISAPSKTQDNDDGNSTFFSNTTNSVDISTYQNDLDNKLDKNWTPPKGKPNRSVIAFLVNKFGSVTELRVTQSSGSTEFDHSAETAVESSAPFNPLPNGYGNDKPVEFTHDFHSPDYVEKPL